MKRAQCLDALRLLASLVLAIGHLTMAPLVPRWMSELLLGGLSSATFFILSGFVVVATPSFWELTAWGTFRKRLKRLLPAHWVGLALVLPAAVAGASRMPMGELWVALAWWLPGMQQLASTVTGTEQWNPPAWAVTPLLLGGGLLAGLRWLEVKRWGIGAVVGLLCLTVMLRMGLDLIPPVPVEEGERMLRHSAILPRLLEILAGGWAGILFREIGASQWLKRDLPLLTGLAVTIGLLLVAASTGGPEGIYLYTHGLYLPLGLFVTVAAYANEGWMDRAASNRWIAHGGSISIYIWLTHIPVNSLIKKAGYRMGMSMEELGSGWVVLFSLLMTIALASICDRIIRFPKSVAPRTPETRAHAAG